MQINSLLISNLDVETTGIAVPSDGSCEDGPPGSGDCSVHPKNSNSSSARQSQ